MHAIYSNNTYTLIYSKQHMRGYALRVTKFPYKYTMFWEANTFSSSLLRLIPLKHIYLLSQYIDMDSYIIAIIAYVYPIHIFAVALRAWHIILHFYGHLTKANLPCDRGTPVYSTLSI